MMNTAEYLNFLRKNSKTDSNVTESNKLFKKELMLYKVLIVAGIIILVAVLILSLIHI